MKVGLNAKDLHVLLSENLIRLRSGTIGQETAANMARMSRELLNDIRVRMSIIEKGMTDPELVAFAKGELSHIFDSPADGQMRMATSLADLDPCRNQRS